MNRFPFNESGFITFGDIFDNLLKDTATTQNNFFPPANITELNDRFELELMVPGRQKEDFKISLDKQLLTVSYEHKDGANEEKKSLKKEFTIRPFKRTFTIDEKINSDEIHAKYENGILTLLLPRKEEVKVTPKEIAVK
ncbi:MAG TPA: Hsp20/alpha crystallin family protein [Ginsengibacter sp.]|nr:Hsp20/alpha crystallin family protein [Ginsengibacter sp.]HUN01392.1 Hsp20/alpha crystallin family protein [Niabella sp.]